MSVQNPTPEDHIRWIVNTSIDDGKSSLKALLGNSWKYEDATVLEILEKARAAEVHGGNRKTLVNSITSAIEKTRSAITAKTVEIIHNRKKPASRIDAQVAEYDRAGEKAYLTDAAPVEVLAPSSLLDGAPNTSLSPIEAAALSAVDTAWADASRLAGMVKTYARAGTAAKSLCGLRLRALREHYFGPRNPNGGRPKKGESSTTWDNMLADRLGITSQTGANWMKMADAIEQLAEHQGLDLRTTCEKLPWDWTPEESALIDATVHKLCEDKTQRDLLQADFLSDLGYEAPEKANSSNNPQGKNGGKKKPASTPAALLKERQEAARLIFLGTDKAGRAEKGSVALFMETFIGNKGADLEALPQGELRDLYEHTVKPFAAAFRKLAGL